jgi:hypothetical protein
MTGDGEGAAGQLGFSVAGQVLNQNGQPLPDVRVRVFSVRLRDESLVGEASTDPGGRYTIDLQRPQALRVGVLDEVNGELASSSVRFPTADVEIVDFSVDSAIVVPSEFERFMARLEPALDGLELQEASASQRSFLAQETGISGARLDALSQAVGQVPGGQRRGDTDPELPAAVWYGWRRQGLDVDTPEFWERSLDDLLGSIRAAAERGVVPASLADGLDELQLRVRALRAERLLDRQPVPGGGSVRDLLATAPASLPVDDQRTIAEVLTDRSPSTGQLGAVLEEAALDTEAAEAAVRIMRLAELTLGRTPTVAALQGRTGAGTSLVGLAEIPADEWLDLAYRHGVPPPESIAVGSGTPFASQSPQAYARSMQSKVETLHPTATLRARLAAGSIRLPVPGGDLVGAFLEANPDFDVSASPVAAAVDALPDGPGMDKSALAQALRTVRRLGSVSSGWDQVEALLQRGIDSVEQIAAMEPGQVAARLDGVVDDADARAIVEQAQAVQATTAAVMGVLRTSSAQGVSVLDGTAVDASADRHASLRALFGPLDSCACGHCRSVLSPAAYLVDLLEFLRLGAPEAFSALLARRPDLADLDLSCANGEVEIPSVDLVLEVLENAAALPLQVDLPAGEDLDAELLRDPLPDEVVVVLRRTARDVGQGLRAVKEPRELQREGFSAWTVTDRDRRWTLHARPESLIFGSSDLAAREISVAGMDLAAVVADLDGGTVQAILDERLRASLDGIPVSAAIVGPQSVTTLEAGWRWQIEYLFQVVIATPAPAGMDRNAPLELRTASGTALVSKTYSANAVEATRAELAEGSTGGLLTALLPQVSTFTVETGPDPESFTKSFVIPFVLTYVPRSLTVAGLTYQSTTDQGDLTASPRNRNLAAYARLRNAQFPWSLPFDLPLAELRALLDRAGCSRRRLLELWLAADALASEALAREALGLSPQQVAQITVSRAAPELWAVWGLQVDNDVATIIDASTGEIVTGSPETVLARVSILMQQSALTHQEVLDVAGSRFVRTAGVAPQPLPFAECVPSRLHLEPVSPAFFDRFHRFVRLWRALGWALADVDAALGAFTTGGDIPAAALVHLSQLVRLHEATGLPVADLIGWYAPPEAGGLPDGERRLAIRRSLSLDDADYRRLLLLTGIDPAGTPAAALLLRDAMSLIRASGFTLRELCYLGRHRLDLRTPADEPLHSETGLAIARSDPEVNAILSGFRAAAGTANAQTDLDTADPVGVVRTGLAGLGWYSTLVDDTVADLQDDLVDPSGADPELVARLRRRRTRLARRLRWATLPTLSADVSVVLDPETVLPQRLAGRVRFEPGAAASGTRIVVAGWFDPEDAAALRPVLGAAATGTITGLRVQSDNWPHPAPADRLLSETAIGQLFAAGSTPVSRLRAVLLGIVRQQQVAAGSSFLGQTLQQPADLVRTVLFELLADPTDGDDPPRSAFEALLASDFVAVDPGASLTNAQYPAQFAVIRKLSKVGVLASRCSLQLPELLAFQGTGPGSAGRTGGLAVIDLNGLPCGTPLDVAVPFLSWLRLFALVGLRSQSAGGRGMLAAYAEAVARSNVSDAQRRTAALSVVAAAVRQPVAQILAAGAQIEHSGLVYQDPRYVDHLLRLLEALTRLRLTVEQVPNLVADDLELGEAEAAAELARAVLRGRYGDAAWDDVIRPVSDRLRVQQRDALVAYLLHRDHLATPDALYERYLIDIQSAPVLVTTRLLQATEAVQLFVNRCLLNLEPQVPPLTINRDRWDWMKAYRVWEAARKVFLWPQQWLRPELRADASDAFQAVQSALGQAEASMEASRDALLGYLDDLVDLSQVTVLGLYEDDRTAPGKSNLYLVGRTANPPHRYYWRMCEDVGGRGQRWQPWHRVDLDVSGSHVAPFVLGGNLHLAWATFRKNQEEPPGAWEVQLAWAKRTSRGWSDKKVSPDTVTVPALPAIDEHRMFAFNVQYTERLDPSLPSIPGVPADEFRIPVAQVAMFTAHDDAASPFELRADQAFSSGLPDVIRGSFVFSCQVLFQDAQGARWPASNVALALWWGAIHAVAGFQTPISGQVSRTFPQWPPSPFFEVPVVPPLAANDIHLDILVNGVKVAERAYPKDPSYARQNKVWNIQVVVRPPETVTTPFGVINPERALRMAPNGSFSVFGDRDARYEAGTQGSIQVPTGAEPYDNGFRELSPRAGDDVGIPISTGSQLLQLFAATRGRFQLVATFPQGRAYWHYQDDVTQCLIRVLPDRRVVIVADSLRLGARFRALAARSTLALYAPRTQELRDGGQTIRLANLPVPAIVTAAEPPAVPQASILEQGVTFDRQSPYGDSHWETFFHLPLLIADHLTREQRFAEAQQWLRLVFDPTSEEARKAVSFDATLYWNFRPFRERGLPDRIEDLLEWLANPRVESKAKEDFKTQIEHWRSHPFEPHEIARLRIGAYQWQVVLAYLANLLSWADSAFRRETRESLVEATMLYVEAAMLLGPRPGSSPPSLTPQPLSYRALKGRWDDFGDAWYSVADSPFMKAILDYLADLRARGFPGVPSDAQVIAQLSGIGVTYFCVPPNDTLLEYWNTVEDRLFNLRHSRNIEGIERQLPFYAPPIDPALLVEAVAAGVDLDQALAARNEPLSPYRFSVLAQKATELCSELKALGSLALSALERQDAEQLARLRAEQEVGLLSLVEQTRLEQVREAEAKVAALRAGREVAASRYRHFQNLLTGRPLKEPTEGRSASEAPSALAFVPPSATDPDLRGLGLVQAEQDQFAQLLESRNRSQEAAISNLIGSVFFAIGSYPTTAPLQGLGHAANALAAMSAIAASTASSTAKRDEIVAGYQRRRDDWVAQSNAALRDLAQIDKQIAAGQIGKALADRELANHRQQMSNAQDIDQFMRAKFSRTELFSWMSSQVATAYFSAYQLALEVARQAEQAFRYELAQPDSTFIRPSYWDSMRRGLVAGERLSQDLKRMEVAYFNRNRREHELTQDISLRQLNPGALVELRATGSCQFDLPEWLFDLRFPGHYLRRLKSVALSLPCVVGRHTPVHARLTLLHSEVRRSAAATPAYPRDPAGDGRFRDDFALAETIVTSGAVEATGVWDPALAGERRMPYEGRGAISTWRLELPAEFPAFDHWSLTDAVMTMRYSARDGGTSLRDGAVAALVELSKDTAQTPHALLLSLRQDFPSEWARLRAPGSTLRSEDVRVSRDRFPYAVAGPSISLTIRRLDVFGVPTDLEPTTTLPDLTLPDIRISGQTVNISNAEPVGSMSKGVATDLSLPVPPSEDDAGATWTISAPADQLRAFADLLFVVTYSAARPST